MGVEVWLFASEKPWAIGHIWLNPLANYARNEPECGATRRGCIKARWSDGRHDLMDPSAALDSDERVPQGKFTR
jgi:hypothetical protein